MAHEPPEQRVLRFADARTADAALLLSLFTALAADDHFKPHPFTQEFIAWLQGDAGRDQYMVAGHPGRAFVAYGMLRGWDAGFEIPSLGIAVHPSARGQGIGREMMNALHRAAREGGARAVRLRVHQENATALGLYRSLGYDLKGSERGQAVMVLTLP